MKEIQLQLPKERFSSIDYFLESFPDPKDISRITINPKAFDRMQEDPYIKLVDGIWVGEEITIDGKYYPPLSYKLLSLKNRCHSVLWIKIGEECYYFSNPKPKSIVIISY